jgi:protein-S-isoprenylcysteine O-methyltransferase Ste14
LRAVFLLAIAGFGWGVRALGSFDTFGVRPVVALLKGIEPRLHPFVIKGPYRWARHPLYFFAILLFWSCPALTPDRLLFNILWTTWVVLATVLEERDLVSQFGEPYIQYQNEVPMILPWRIPARRTQDRGSIF